MNGRAIRGKAFEGYADRNQAFNRDPAHGVFELAML
jgi:hypothetical protein